MKKLSAYLLLLLFSFQIIAWADSSNKSSGSNRNTAAYKTGQVIGGIIAAPFYIAGWALKTSTKILVSIFLPPEQDYQPISEANNQAWGQALTEMFLTGVNAYQNYQTQKSNQRAWNNYNQAVAMANRQYAVQQAQAQGAYSQALAAYNDASRAQSQEAYAQAVAAYNARVNAYNAAQAQTQAAYQALVASNARANAYQPTYQQQTYLTQAEAEAVVRQQWRSNLAPSGGMADMDYNTNSEFQRRVDELTGRR